jgi:multicomponent K+:H+ antiporter subunit E
MSLRTKLLPRPRLSLFLVVIWLLLHNSVATSVVFFGIILGWVIPLLSHRFWPETHRPSRPMLFARYTLRVIKDIVSANFEVARLILGSPEKIRPAFVTYPLELEQSFAITVLASTISLTPGTVSSDVSADRKFLLIHTLDLDSEEELIRTIKERYETPLREIFK